jgi:hypothetical protein
VNLRAVAIAATLVAGILFRFWLATLGYNYDVESYWIVGHVADYNVNVYEVTARYNYGPVWFLLLTAFARATSAMGIQAFHLVIAIFLTAVDVGIALFLRKRFGWIVALLFFVNPVSAFITGYHSQFDNLAVLIGLAGLELYRSGIERSLDRRRFVGLLVIGVSLMTKHILILLPLWLALRPGPLKARLTAVGLPLGVFVAGFFPFLSAWEEIVDNVVLYQSQRNAPLLGIFLPEAATQESVIPMIVFVTAMIAIGYAVRAQSLITSALIYLVALVAFAPAMANQYLAIPIAAAAVFPNIAFNAYTIAASAFLSFSIDGLNVRAPVALDRNGVFSLLALLLMIALGLILRREATMQRSSDSRPMLEVREYADRGCLGDAARESRVR